MNLREVNWRLALYSGGLVGGIMWAVLAAVVLDAQNGSGATRFTVTAGSWLLILTVSVAVLMSGAVTAAVGRSVVVRSVGIGLAVSALAGWVMIRWIAVQFLLGV